MSTLFDGAVMRLRFCFLISIGVVTLVITSAMFSFARSQADSSEKLVSVQIIFDASGSMNEEWKGQTKLEAAKSGLEEALRGLEGNPTRISLRAFGFDADMEKKGESCFNSKVLIPFDRGSVRTVVDAARDLEAHGKTPIARSLRSAGKDLKPYAKSKSMILLITDGRETCGGDPVRVVRRLKADGLDVSVHVIGLDLNERSRKEMEAIARAGDGVFHHAQDKSELKKRLEDFAGGIKREAKRVRSRDLSERREVSGGESLGLPERIGKGAYRLGRDLPTGKRAYFFVPSRKAQLGVVKVWPVEGESSPGRRFGAGVGVDVFEPDGKRVLSRSERIRGGETELKPVRYFDANGDGFLFSLGDDYMTVRKDSTFDIDLIGSGDGRPATEAPTNPGGRPHGLEYDKAIKAHLGLEDGADMFLVKAPPSMARSVNVVIVFEDPDFGYQLQVYDPESGRRLKGFSTSKGKSKSKIPVLESTPGLWLKLSDKNPPKDKRFSPYTITITSE